MAVRLCPFTLIVVLVISLRIPELPERNDFRHNGIVPAPQDAEEFFRRNFLCFIQIKITERYWLPRSGPCPFACVGS